MKRFLPLILSVLTTTGWAADRGWTVGGGLVSSDIVNAEKDDPIFPFFEIENKQFMFLPNLSYQWDQWSIGADGIGWTHKTNADLSIDVKAGYPRSSASIGGQKGWFRYGANSSLSYSNGLTATQGITLGPGSYAATVGFGDRRDDFSQKFSLGFPLFLKPSLGLTVIGTGFVEQENASFIHNDFELDNPLSQEHYWHQGLNAFAVYQINSRATLLVSGTLQWNDKTLVSDISSVARSEMNIFTMFSYFLGKRY